MPRSAPGRRIALSTRVARAGLVVATLVVATSVPASAQFEKPCEVACAGVLGATGFVAATGASIAYGRLTGGMSTINQGVVVWGATFAAVVGGGMALSGNGPRQERTVYAAGIGTLAGAAVGLAVEAARTGGDQPRVLAGTLIGAAVGAVVGGVYGALSYDEGGSGGSVPVMTISIPL